MLKKRLIKIAILLAVFLAGNFVFVRLMNTESTESAADLAMPTLPLVYINIGGMSVNSMQGYTAPMDGTQIRDSVIPLTTDRTISISYKAFSNDVQSVTYELITPDTGQRIENAKITGFRDNGDSRTATFSLSSPILMDREYPICFCVKTSAGDYYYYSRVLQRADLIINQYIEFVNSFYQTCINKQAAGEINTYIEPDDTVPNTNFATVNIYSSLDQITWGSMRPSLFRKAIPCIKEINPVTCSMTCEYLISSANANGVNEIYHVFEFYRMRYYNSNILLLDFDRQALQDFDAATGPVTASGLNLGVSTRDVHFRSNEASTIVAFVQDGALWTFNGPSEKLSKVFSFHSETEGSDERCDTAKYNIRILRVASSGDVDFVVYGYMNRGLHEGRNGISVYHFSAERVNVEELAFIPVEMGTEELAMYAEALSYMSAGGNYYTRIGDSLYSFDLEKKTCDVLLTGIEEGNFVSAMNGRYAAWNDQMDPDHTTTIKMIDFDTGNTRELRSGEGQLIRVIGYINDDLIYGLANENDLMQLPAGGTLFAMKQVNITSFDGQEVKEYNPEGLWIKDVTIEEGLISFSRVARTANGYQEASSDDIMNNKQMNETLVKTDAVLSARQGTILSLVMPRANTNISPLVSTAKIRTPSRDVTIPLPENSAKESGHRYFVYTHGKLRQILADPAKAVRNADAEKGVVLDETSRYVYERGNKEVKIDLANEDIPKIMLDGELNARTIAENTEGKTVLDLSGCTLEQVLYFISEGNAVAALRADGSQIVITGYDYYNTLLYNKETGAHFYEALDDSDPNFTFAGNVFVACLDDKATTRN